LTSAQFAGVDSALLDLFKPVLAGQFQALLIDTSDFVF
jgi:hypothetical protein